MFYPERTRPCHTSRTPCWDTLWGDLFFTGPEIISRFCTLNERLTDLQLSGCLLNWSRPVLTISWRTRYQMKTVVCGRLLSYVSLGPLSCCLWWNTRNVWMFGVWSFDDPWVVADAGSKLQRSNIVICFKSLAVLFCLFWVVSEQDCSKSNPSTFFMTMFIHYIFHI